jgi:hypothetical protein
MDRGDGRCACSNKYFQFCVLVIMILLTACTGGRIMAGSYINEAKRFAVPLPPNGWSVETDEEADLLLRHQFLQAGMVVNATCGEIPSDRALEVVSRHLFFGIDRKEMLRQERRMTPQGEALEAILRGELGGQELLLHAYILRGPGCVYDFVLYASPDEYSQLNGEFEALVGQFQLLGVETR